MDPLQRTAGPAPTASSPDPPRIRRSERNSPVKNRMRETCTSGSVRGGDGDIPTYSALDAPQRGDEALERGLVCEPGLRVEERQPAGVVRIREHGQHPAAEEARQRVDVHEEVGAAGDPSRSV